MAHFPYLRKEEVNKIIGSQAQQGRNRIDWKTHINNEILQKYAQIRRKQQQKPLNKNVDNYNNQLPYYFIFPTEYNKSNEYTSFMDKIRLQRIKNGTHRKHEQKSWLNQYKKQRKQTQSQLIVQRHPSQSYINNYSTLTDKKQNQASIGSPKTKFSSEKQYLPEYYLHKQDKELSRKTLSQTNISPSRISSKKTIQLQNQKYKMKRLPTQSQISLQNVRRQYELETQSNQNSNKKKRQIPFSKYSHQNQRPKTQRNQCKKVENQQIVKRNHKNQSSSHYFMSNFSQESKKTLKNDQSLIEDSFDQQAKIRSIKKQKFENLKGKEKFSQKQKFQNRIQNNKESQIINGSFFNQQFQIRQRKQQQVKKRQEKDKQKIQNSKKRQKNQNSNKFNEQLENQTKKEQKNYKKNELLQDHQRKQNNKAQNKLNKNTELTLDQKIDYKSKTEKPFKTNQVQKFDQNGKVVQKQKKQVDKKPLNKKQDLKFSKSKQGYDRQNKQFNKNKQEYYYGQNFIQQYQRIKQERDYLRKKFIEHLQYRHAQQLPYKVKIEYYQPNTNKKSKKNQFKKN